ncbi:cell lysis protein [Diplodia corticola]|uniref:Reticulon-like protein n=1 Tax=Diplodia corticola TaxID=236234 RepID=A0A1J9R6W8_9PEZI|nr:cell lysis protein [Diplodia corticola]OJD36281.1 cell lysis protein [Diplodia corticola]
MTTEAPPQIPTPDLSITHGGNYVDLDPTAPVQDFPEHSAPEPISAPAAEPSPQTNGTYKAAIVNSAQSAMDSVQNSSFAQQAVNGPVGQSVKTETAKTQSEFRDLADARRVPGQPAATGQPLTHYHSMFYRLLSWRNPRATAISFACSVLFIFTARYVNIVRYIFKLLWVTLGCTAFAEVAGQAALGHGLATQMRPRKYYMIRKDSLERLTDDLEQFINFFVIEFQRVVFVENIYVSAACFVASFISYFLIKWLPLWGLGLIATVLVYMGPLVYIQNKEYIDEQLRLTNQMLNEQTNQFKDLAAQHSTRAQKQLKVYANEYSNKAQDFIGQAKSKAFPARSRPTTPAAPAAAAPVESAPPPEMTHEKAPVQEADFPEAPTAAFATETPEVPQVHEPVHSFDNHTPDAVAM